MKENKYGIISLLIGWLIPIAGLIFGIISLSKKEPIKSFGIIGICSSILWWIFWGIMVL